MTTEPDNIETLRGYLAEHPEHRPIVPRGPGLGLGGRMGALAAVSAMRAVERLGIEAAAVQASVFRELRPEFVEAENTFVEYKGIGRVPVGHTGMTIRGQFLQAVRERVRNGITAAYVADADHIPLRSDRPADIAEFRQFIVESRDRTFFTVDPHLCVDDSAAQPGDKLGRLVAAFTRAADVIGEVKQEAPYVIELSIDECVGVTSVAEMRFLIERIAQRDVPLFSIAPAIGFDKKDQDDPELRRYLQRVLPELHRVACDHGMVLGIHSGDGKGDDTLGLIAEATEGKVWYKVSPDRQRMFFTVLADSPHGSDERRLFEDVFEHLVEMVRQMSESGDSEFAANCRASLAELKEEYNGQPTSDCRMFHDFGFLLVRDYKDQFDALGDDFVRRYVDADINYIENLARQLGM